MNEVSRSAAAPQDIQLFASLGVAFSCDFVAIWDLAREELIHMVGAGGDFSFAGAGLTRYGLVTVETRDEFAGEPCADKYNSQTFLRVRAPR